MHDPRGRLETERTGGHLGTAMPGQIRYDDREIAPEIVQKRIPQCPLRVKP
jgi:hypothetical protein